MAAAQPHLPAWLAFDGAPDAEPGGTAIGGASARTRDDLFDALTTALALPEHFGRNWDALADVLADRLDAGPLTLVVRDAGDLLADEPPAQFGTLLDVLGGVAAGGRHSLRVLLHDRADRLPALRHRIAAALGGHVGVPPADPR
ncbi:barstar family protein [Micromonospora yasonensis]|uniref:barstar family protein n=1 Tax=Micromonospora yasonensis TaxID=1128667 RepID=UPI00223153AE|nr:barstar family protein [Micromonospora yasonensis]MCW3840989.1 barstar family protein [Micromonospora yasonensis]